jgi:3-oxoacyl-(acyl-carrier-protein) synthase
VIPVAITGVGVITPLGDNLSALGEALLAGRSAVARLLEPEGAMGALLPNFEATRYANVRGMRIYSRATRLGICAARLALNDAGLDGKSGTGTATGTIDGKDLGLVTSFSFAHMETLIEYDRGLVTQGVQQTNPALMPLGIPSAPAAVAAIAFSAQAFSITLSDGGAGGLDALGLATRLLAQGRARACVVVSAAAHSPELALSAWRSGQLSRQPDFTVFDRGSRGTALGEAGVALVLEPVDVARQRGARCKGVLHAQASRFAMKPQERAHALAKAARAAVAASGMSIADVALVSSGANGVPEVDRVEAQALLELLGERAAHTPVIAVKAALGETLEAAGLLHSLVALRALASKQAPPVAGLQTPMLSGLDYAIHARDLRAGPALVTCTSSTGACSALLLSADDS